MAYLEIRRLPPGDAGTDQTLRAMAAMAKRAAASFPGEQLWWNLSGRDRCLAIRDWLRIHTVYQDDPPGVELVREPMEMMQMLVRGADAAPGDCDDVATLGATIALAAGLKVRWRVLRFGRGSPYAHVFAEIAPPEGGRWIDLDVHRPAALPGLPSGVEIISTAVEL